MKKLRGVFIDTAPSPNTCFLGKRHAKSAKSAGPAINLRIN